MTNTVRTWKAKGKGGGSQKVNSYDYFLKNNIVSCGWSFPDVPGREKISSLKEYEDFWEKQIKKEGGKSNWKRQGVHQLFDVVKKGDFIWTRKDGIYYVAEVKKEPTELFKFDTSSDAVEYDCSAQLTDIKWIRVGTEEDVPGSVSVYTKNRSAICKVDNRDNEIVLDGERYTTTSVISALFAGTLNSDDINNLNRLDLFNLLGYSEVEDLVALWLYNKYGYVVIPSTNKIGTEKYEFVLIDTTKNKNNEYDSSRRIYIQVKNGNVNLSSSKYTDLIKSKNEEVWLVTTLGHIDDDIENKIKRLNFGGSEEKYGINELLDFAFDIENKNIIPNSIYRWIELIR